MATLALYTASNRPRVSSREFLEKVIDRYQFRGYTTELTVEVVSQDEHDELVIHGRTGFAAYPDENVNNSDDLADPEKEDTERFLKEIAPFLEEKLVVQTVGHEKLRFPLLGSQYAVWPDKTVSYTKLDSNPEHPESDEEDN